MLGKSHFDERVSANSYVYHSTWYFEISSLHYLTAIPVLLFATVGLFLVLYMHHSWGVVGSVLAHSQLARHTMRSIMLTSWILFLWLMVHFYAITRVMADDVQEEVPLSIFPDFYTPQVTAGYVEWGSFLTIQLLEAPFLCVFLFCKFTDLNNRKQQLSKTDCRLCYWIRVLCDTFGAIGVVAAVQIISVYLFYSTLYLIVSPIFTIAWVSIFAAYILVGIVCTTMLLEMVSSCCKTCSFDRTIKGLAFLLLGLLCITINACLVAQLKGDKQGNHNSIRDLLTSLVSSVIIGIYGYIVKKLLYQKKKDIGEEEQKNLESAPLIQKEENIP